MAADADDRVRNPKRRRDLLHEVRAKALAR
jgi:hypothetical protein